ncbi:STAS domain-containing protein, partial [Rhizobiaceae sp. 2RAB30]
LLAMLLFLSPALKVLPIPALGAILVAAALSLIDLEALRQIWRISPMELGFAIIAMLGPISLGVLYGVVIAIGATLLYVLRKMMFPRDAMLGRKAGSDGFYKLHHHPDAQPVPGLAIYLIQGSLLFFSADFVETRLRTIIDGLPGDTEWVLLDAGAIVQVDSTGAAVLDNIAAELSRRGIALGLVELHAETRELLERAGVVAHIGQAMIFQNLDDALRAFEARAAAHH